MSVTLERITAPEVYLLRGGTRHQRHGDPYSFAALVELHGDTAEIKGAVGRLAAIPELRSALKAIGAKRAVWHRSVAGTMIQHTMNVDANE